jgi:hypothetical protein
MSVLKKFLPLLLVAAMIVLPQLAHAGGPQIDPDGVTSGPGLDPGGFSGK